MEKQSHLHLVGRPNIGDRAQFLRRVNDILDRRWLTNGGIYCEEFERRVAELLGVRECVAMCNATVALEIAIRALGLTGEVIVPSFTFVATAHALQWQEITPVFADVDPETHNLDPKSVERMITPRTTAILAVHLWGRPCPTDTLTEIAERHGLKLLYDASHAFGCSHQGKMIGGFGNAEIFSFHATKFINTMEGGVVTTQDPELAEKLRFMRNFGFVGYDQVDYLGINGKMNEISAAMGLTNLESLDQYLAVNQRNYEAYHTGLADIPGLNLLAYNQHEKCNWQYIAVEIDAETAGISRDELVSHLHANQVIARRYFYPGCHRMEPYRSLFPHAGLLLPETERLTDRIMVLPTGTAMSAEDVATVCQFIREAVAKRVPIAPPGAWQYADPAAPPLQRAHA